MCRTLASRLPDLGAALQRAAKQHAPRWLSETWEAASAELAHPSRSAGNAVQSRHAAGHGNVSSALDGCQHRALARSGPLSLWLRNGSCSVEAGMSRSATVPMAISRMLLTSTLVPAAHVMHSTVSAPTGCVTAY